MKRTLWLLALALCGCAPSYRPDEHEWKIIQKNQYEPNGAWYYVHEQNSTADTFWVKSNDASYQVGDVLAVCKKEKSKQ